MPPGPAPWRGAGGHRRYLLPAVFLLAAALTASTTLFAQRAFIVSPPGASSLDIPRISPDGRTIAFKTSGDARIYLVRPDGSGLRGLWHVVYFGMNLSGDGRLLVYDGYGDAFPEEGIFALDTVTLQLTELSTEAEGSDVYLPGISAEGAKIAYEGYAGVIYSVDPDGSNRQAISGTNIGCLGGTSLTGDGTWVAFDSCGPEPGIQIFKVMSDGSNLTRLTYDPDLHAFKPRIAADGSRISYEERHSPETIFVMDGDGSNVRQLSTGVQIAYWGEGRDYSAMSGDGGVVAYKGDRGIFVVRTDGTGLRQLANAGAGATGQVALNHRGDILVHTGLVDGENKVIARGVPGITPSELEGLAFDADRETLSWLTLPSANSHNLYRADLGSLSADNAGACLQGSILGTVATDSASPPPGEGFAYTVAGDNATGEGSLGWTSDWIERLAGIPCPPADSDGDGAPDILDTCPLTPDPLQEDQDGDGFGDLCDNCNLAPNPVQRDRDADGIADACECHVLNNPGQPDSDGDDQIDSCDNCPSVYNPALEYLGSPEVQVLSPSGNPALSIGTDAIINWTATDECGGVRAVDIYLSRTGVEGPYEPIAFGVRNNRFFTWTVTGPATQGPKGFMRVVARDPAGHTAQAESAQGFRIN